jgi:bile acid:Na+ symporter, BASS family
MVGAFEQAVLALMIFVIMLGMGASLTVRDFTIALKRPQGLLIGAISQYGFMPLIAFILAVLLPVSNEVKIGLLIMGCMPGGTTSNIFTYFSKGNLALSVLMTVNSTVLGVVLIPVLLVFYLALLQASGVDVEVPASNIVVTLILLAGAGGDRHGGAAVECQCGRLDRGARLGAGARLHRDLAGELGAAKLAVPDGHTLVGVLGRDRTRPDRHAVRLSASAKRCSCIRAMRAPWRWKPGIQNGPLAIAIVALTFTGPLAPLQQGVMAVPALYSLFIVLTSAAVTLYFRRANEAAEQKMPDSLL